jgi:hypothetical protein
MSAKRRLQPLETAMQAIVLKDDFLLVSPPPCHIIVNHIPPPDVFFGFALQNTIARLQNERVGYEYFTLRAEGQLEWSIMGMESCEFILVKLDPSFTCFDVISLLPEEARIHWRFSKASMDKDIYNALSTLFL